jgi:hypothetical protein
MEYEQLLAASLIEKIHANGVYCSAKKEIAKATMIVIEHFFTIDPSISLSTEIDWCVDMADVLSIMKKEIVRLERIYSPRKKNLLVKLKNSDENLKA